MTPAPKQQPALQQQPAPKPGEQVPGLIAPAGGWILVLMANGSTYHVLDPADDPRAMPEHRRALCGRGPAFPVTLPGIADVREAAPLCRACRKTLGHYAEPLPPTHGPDPLLHLLRAGGLDAGYAATAAGICRGYLASEANSAIARGEVVLNERATRRAFAGRDTTTLRTGALMLAWARDVVHGRRVWPPDPIDDPPGEPE